jgi:hypothetical protein
VIRSIAGFEADWIHSDEIEIQPGHATPTWESGPVIQLAAPVRLKYPDDVALADGSGDGFYRVYLRDDGTLTLSRSAFYTVNAGEGMGQRKIPLAIRRHNGGFLPFQVYGAASGRKHIYTGFTQGSPYAVLSGGTATTWTFADLSPMFPYDDARLARVAFKLTPGGVPGTLYLRTPGITNEIQVANSCAADPLDKLGEIEIITDSQGRIEYTLNAPCGQVSLYVRGYEFRDPV